MSRLVLARTPEQRAAADVFWNMAGYAVELEAAGEDASLVRLYLRRGFPDVRCLLPLTAATWPG